MLLRPKAVEQSHVRIRAAESARPECLQISGSLDLLAECPQGRGSLDAGQGIRNEQ